MTQSPLEMVESSSTSTTIAMAPTPNSGAVQVLTAYTEWWQNTRTPTCVVAHFLWILDLIFACPGAGSRHYFFTGPLVDKKLHSDTTTYCELGSRPFLTGPSWCLQYNPKSSPAIEVTLSALLLSLHAGSRSCRTSANGTHGTLIRCPAPCPHPGGLDIPRSGMRL